MNAGTKLSIVLTRNRIGALNPKILKREKEERHWNGMVFDGEHAFDELRREHPQGSSWLLAKKNKSSHSVCSPYSTSRLCACLFIRHAQRNLKWCISTHVRFSWKHRDPILTPLIIFCRRQHDKAITSIFLTTDDVAVINEVKANWSMTYQWLSAEHDDPVKGETQSHTPAESTLLLISV